jgi:hypothetical protein
MKKVLLVGCGNIGALYDINNEEILTYAKAFSLKECEVFVHDLNEDLLTRITNKYHYNPIFKESDLDFSSFDLICIATNTNSHFPYLIKSMKSNVSTIICEKPISNTINELDQLKKEYSQGNTKIFVNYIRRFQPSYFKLKELIKNNRNRKLASVNFRYKKGFLNNGSHGLDLIQFLFDTELKLNNCFMYEKVYDFFKEDPTCSLICKENDFQLNIQGFSNVNYNIFEIDLFFGDIIISILESGNMISLKSEDKTEIFESNALKDYMIPVIDLICPKNGTATIADNFIKSLELNEKMISLIQ